MFSFNKEEAQNAGSNRIEKSGYYICTITDAELISKDSGAKFVRLSLEDDFGKSTRTDILVVKKNGEKAFGQNFIQSLMGTLRIVNLQHDANMKFQMLINKRIGVVLEREEYLKSDGSGIGYKFNVLHFCDQVSNKTYSESSQNKEAKSYKQEVKDNLVANTNSQQNITNQNNSYSTKIAEEGLPFWSCQVNAKSKNSSTTGEPCWRSG